MKPASGEMARSTAAKSGKVNVRLIFAPELGKSERRAVLDAARAFARFGVTSDHVDAKPSLMDERLSQPSEQGRLIHQTKRGEEINSVLTGETSDDYDDIAELLRHRSRWEDTWPDRTSLGVGVAPDAISRWVPQLGTTAYYPGFVHSGEAGIISTSSDYSNTSLSTRLRLAIIRAVAKHELGHLLGRSGHCGNDECIMQDRAVNQAFIEYVVKAGLDFCGKCEKEIRRWVKSQATAGQV